MTPKQREQFNRMRDALKKIARGYHTPERLIKDAESMFGVSPVEMLFMAYSNIQIDASNAVRGVREA